MTGRTDLLGTPKLYELLAQRLVEDEDWQSMGSSLNFTMTHVYQGEPEQAVSFRFADGDLTEVTDGRIDPAADFVLSGPWDVWERMLLSGALSPQVALVSRELSVQGPLNALISQMSAFNQLFELLTEVASDSADGEGA